MNTEQKNQTVIVRCETTTAEGISTIYTLSNDHAVGDMTNLSLDDLIEIEEFLRHYLNSLPDVLKKGGTV